MVLKEKLMDESAAAVVHYCLCLCGEQNETPAAQTYQVSQELLHSAGCWLLAAAGHLSRCVVSWFVLLVVSCVWSVTALAEVHCETAATATATAPTSQITIGSS